MVGKLRVEGSRARFCGDSVACKCSGGSQTSLGKFGFAKVCFRPCAGSIVYIPLPSCPRKCFASSKSSDPDFF